MTPSSIVFLISVNDALKIHEMVIARFGGRQGIHNLGLLESALSHPLMVIEYGNEKEQDISYLAATYFFHIIKNHPFVDGNKRTGLLTAINFLYYNNYELDSNFEDLYEDLYQLSIETASSKINKEDVTTFFKKIIKKIE